MIENVLHPLEDDFQLSLADIERILTDHCISFKDGFAIDEVYMDGRAMTEKTPFSQFDRLSSLLRWLGY